MMQVIRRSLQLLMLNLILLTGTAFAAEIDLGGCDLVFVDAQDDTGYYVDLNEQNFRNDNEVTARIEIVKADQNQLYLYTIYFNRRRQLYQVLKSVIADYGTREIIGGSEKPMRPVYYNANSPMYTVAEFIFHPSP